MLTDRRTDARLIAISPEPFGRRIKTTIKIELFANVAASANANANTDTLGSVIAFPVHLDR